MVIAIKIVALFRGCNIEPTHSSVLCAKNSIHGRLWLVIRACVPVEAVSLEISLPGKWAAKFNRYTVPLFESNWPVGNISPENNQKQRNRRYSNGDSE